jgi:hypothetical protein
VLVLLRESQHVWPWPRAQEQMHSHNIVKDPPRGWVLPRLPLVVGTRRIMVREDRTDAVLQGRLAYQTHRHDQQQRHAPCGRFEIAGRGQQRRVCEDPNAPFRRLLACRACQQGLR